MKPLTTFCLAALLLAPQGKLHAADETKAQNTIDLSNWKLTLPIGASGAPAGHPLEISAEQLSAGYTNADYFHRGAEGQLIFWCPVQGARTENTDYSRCELREVINPTDDHVCWSAQGTHSMDVSCRVMEVPSGQKVVIGQIHAYSGKASPLIKLQFFKGRVEALVKDKARQGRDIKLTFPEVGLNQDFDFQIKLQDGLLNVTVNGATQSENVFKLDPAWAEQRLYFKAGVYPQDNEGPASEGARVSFSKLKVNHAEAASPGMAVQPDYFDDAYIKATLVKVAAWQLRQPHRIAPRGADQGVFHTGLFAAYQATGNESLLAAVISMGETNQWKPGPKLMFPDHHIILNPYIELFRLRQEPRMIQPASDFVAAYLKSPANDTQNRLITWWLCDYLFMDPPVLAKLGLMFKRPALLAKSDAMWHACYDLLFDKQRDLFDVSPKNAVYKGFNGIKPGEREANGEKIFWGCGNGWVLGGLALLLKELPTDYKERPFYEDVFKRMAKSIVALQQPDGLWRASLLDPPAYPRAESTGSALFTYGLAYGLNAGLLPRADYEAAVKKAWAGLNSICLQPDFRIGWSEGSVARPVKNYNQDSAHWLSAGAFLLAGSEVLNCAFVPRANRNQGAP